MRTALVFLCIFTFLQFRGNAQTPAASADSIGYYCGICGGDCDTMTFHQPGVCPHCGMTLIKMTYAAKQEMMQKYRQPMTICFYLQDGVEVLDFAGPMEVFSYAGFKVFTVSRKKEAITTQGILKVLPDYSIDDAPPSDILAFFGGNTGPSSHDPAVIAWIKGREAGTKYFFSVCTGAFIMGRAGLLDSLSATTFHSSIESLRQALPQTHVLAGVRFVDNGKVITTAGISAGIDGALHLVSRLRGSETAREVAEYMEYDKWVPNQGLVLAGANDGGGPGGGQGSKK